MSSSGRQAKASCAVQDVATSYIKSAFPDGGLTAKQTIEIKLAVYAGMAGMYGLMIENTERPDDEAFEMLQAYETALTARAIRLNNERKELS